MNTANSNNINNHGSISMNVSERVAEQIALELGLNHRLFRLNLWFETLGSAATVKANFVVQMIPAPAMLVSLGEVRLGTPADQGDTAQISKMVTDMARDPSHQLGAFFEACRWYVQMQRAAENYGQTDDLIGDEHRSNCILGYAAAVAANLENRKATTADSDKILKDVEEMRVAGVTPVAVVDIYVENMIKGAPSKILHQLTDISFAALEKARSLLK